jgi:hypothetical protein
MIIEIGIKIVRNSLFPSLMKKNGIKNKKR